MKTLRTFIVGIAFIGLSACGSSSNANDTSAITVPATTTTVSKADCSYEALDAAVGEKDSYILGCVSNWAAVQPNSWECGEHCYGFIYKWEQENWSLKMKCSQYSHILEEGTCTGMIGQISEGNYTSTIAEMPPKEVACQIWARAIVDPVAVNQYCS